MINATNETYISVDIEASGPIPGEYSMLSLGACLVKNKEINFYMELKPLNSNFQQSAMDVNKLSMEKLMIEGTDPDKAMESFARWVLQVSKGTFPVFISFGTFDWMFVKWYLVKFGFAKLFGPNGCDIKSYYMGMFNKSWAETAKKHIPSFLKSSLKHTHNALDDAMEQAELFENLLNFNETSASSRLNP